MSFEGVTEMQTTDEDDLMHHLLDVGWELLAVTPGRALPMYTLGRRAKKHEMSGAGPDVFQEIN